MTDCPDCGEPLSSLWRNPPPHTEEFHAQVRRRLVNYLKILLKEKAAGKLGHRITIRFTQQHAWSECTCGYHGYVEYSAMSARNQGHTHLYSVWCQFEIWDSGTEVYVVPSDH